MAKLIAVTNQRHAETETGERAEKSDDCSLAEKNPNDLREICAERFHDSDLTPFLHGHGDVFRQNDIAQLVDRFLLLVAVRVLQFLNAVENLPEISGRINGELVANADAQLPRKIDTEHDRFAFEIEFSLDNEFA